MARSTFVAEHYPSYHTAKREAVVSFEKRYLSGLLELADGNLTAAAKIAGMHRAAIYRMLKRHGLRRRLVLTPEVTRRAAKALAQEDRESREIQEQPAAMGRRRQGRRKAR